ncbi:threonylcarbamoyl-AMP synthase [Candidatus Uhrbacteria bacterium]|nr:threonylcarbamoyl-AMP synthase [Candidatus Uhrbacteria bacterium]
MLKNADIAKAILILRKGGVVAIPTETAYGLAADSMNPSAVKKIFLIKGRSKTKPLPLIAASLKMVKKFFYLSKIEEKLARDFWPGPLTMLLKSKRKFPPALIRGKKKIAVRVSSSPVAAEISARLGRPITSTSANLSGRNELYSAAAVAAEFKNKKAKPDMILDGGRLPRRKPSTIIEFQNGRIIILRKGQIKFRN